MLMVQSPELHEMESGHTPATSAFRGQRQVDEEFTSSLRYIVSLRTAWATGDPDLPTSQTLKWFLLFARGGGVACL